MLRATLAGGVARRGRHLQQVRAAFPARLHLLAVTKRKAMNWEQLTCLGEGRSGLRPLGGGSSPPPPVATVGDCAVASDPTTSPAVP